MNHDVLAVGSGLSGAMAAQTLVESGLNVGMLDVGRSDEHYRNIIPSSDFSTVRCTDPQQHEYFLGSDFEGLDWGEDRVGSQLTPLRPLAALHWHITLRNVS